MTTWNWDSVFEVGVPGSLWVRFGFVKAGGEDGGRVGESETLEMESAWMGSVAAFMGWPQVPASLHFTGAR